MCVRARVRACVRARVRACVYVCVRTRTVHCQAAELADGSVLMSLRNAGVYYPTLCKSNNGGLTYTDCEVSLIIFLYMTWY